jgi:hypothetical protein
VSFFHGGGQMLRGGMALLRCGVRCCGAALDVVLRHGVTLNVVCCLPGRIFRHGLRIFRLHWLRPGLL